MRIYLLLLNMSALQILPTCVFNKKDPIVVGVEVVEGIARIGTPLAVPTQQGIELGRIASLELNHKAVDSARAGQSVAMKIEPGGMLLLLLFVAGI
jgi:translation initiation factor 5B